MINPGISSQRDCSPFDTHGGQFDLPSCHLQPITLCLFFETQIKTYLIKHVFSLQRKSR